MTATRQILLKRLKTILQTEGLSKIFLRTFKYIAGFFFQFGTFYIYEHTMRERIENEFFPSIKNLTFQMVSSNKQADELAANGLEFRSYSIYTSRRLDKGAIAFCFFVGHDLAHISWVALTKEAKNTFDPIPYQIDFSNKEAWTGGSFTIPKFEGQGLMKYGYYKRLDFLREQGIRKSINIVSVKNIASQKAQAHFSPKIRGKAFYLKIFLWQYWKEMPL